MKLELQGIKKSFDGTEILHGINFSVEGGSALGLLGRNGAGKTTTIRIIMDVFHADEGQVLLDGAPFVYQPGQVGYLPEERGLYPKRLISEQLVYLAKLRGMNKKQAEENMRKWLTRLDVILSSHQMSYVEEFCEDIVVINHGEVALAGNLDKIKEEYGKGHKAVAAVGMESEELEQILRDKFADQVQVISHNKHHVVTQILPEQDEWQVLSRFKELGIRLRSYGVYEPSLNDIFVSAVGDEETPEDIKEKNNIGTSFSEFEPKQKKGLFGKRG